MNTLIETVVSNAVVATLVAVGVAIATRLIRRPEVAYWLWMLVLLKLVTPPCVHMPLPVGRPSELTLPDEHDWEAKEVSNHGDAKVGMGSGGAMRRPSMQELGPRFHHESSLADALGRPPEQADAVPIATDRASGQQRALAAPIAPRVFWTATLLGLWLAGSVFWVALAAFRVVSFGRLIRRAETGPECLQAAVGQLATQFGLRRCPQVYVVAARVPPLLWKTGRRVLIVLPSDLIDQLGRTEQTALLAHELAHYRRGDHLFRWVEATILGVYWWHPVVWWARRRLHEAEEHGCDAWVLWALPGEAKRYAHTLVTAVDFLSGGGDALPATASSMEHTGTLRRRLEMILRKSLRRRMSWSSFALVVMSAVLVLPWAARTVPAEDSDKIREAVSVESATVLPEPTKAAVEGDELDNYGDPMPKKAVFRLGTRRLRHRGRPYCVAFSPDGQTMATFGDPGIRAVRLWDVQSGRLVQRMTTGAERCAGAVAFSPDGSRCLAVEYEGTVHLWDVHTGKEILTLESGQDDTIRLWDLTSGKQVLELQPNDTRAVSFAFSPDGQRLIAGMDNGTALVWDISGVH